MVTRYAHLLYFLLATNTLTSPWCLALHLFGQVNSNVASDSNTAEQQTGQPLNSFGQPTYGVDVSFPIHRSRISDNYAWLPHNVDPANNPTPPQYVGKPIQYLGNKQKEYDEFMQGCHDYYGKKGSSWSVCSVTEQDRVEMSLRQPASMQNYTELGFKKIKAPKEVWDRIKSFWDENKDRKNW